MRSRIWRIKLRMKINQFHSGTAVGDAITNEMLLIKDILIKNGYESEIYAEHIADGLKKDIKDIKSYKGNKDSILIIHHSMGFDLFDNIINLPDKKIIIYHNITPEHFFDDEFIKRYIRKGLKQTAEYRKYVDLAYADSNFSRKEMIAMGYKNVGIIPVQISLDRFDKTDVNKELEKSLKAQTNFIFVGRVVKNKKQVDIIKTFNLYHNYFDKKAKLFIIGDTSNVPYLREVENAIKENDLSENVVLTGKINESDLKTYYANASAFICMSEHEGFGVPLLEAMKMNVPLIAFDSSAILETMGGAGISFDKKNYTQIAALLNEIVTNTSLREKLVKHQQERIKKLSSTDTEKLILDAIKNIDNKNRKQTLQMQGPFETSYSLAIVNRKLIEELHKNGNFDVSIYPTEGPGDYLPKDEDLKDKPLAKELYLKSKNVSYPDITIRNMYPPRAKDANGGLNFYSFAWEESIIPEQFIRDFNKYCNGVGTTSQFVTDKLIECGLNIPVKTIGNGVDLVDNYNSLKPYPLKSKKGIKFLHISSAFPRKGVDVLLKGFYEAFTDKDDVCLVLKTFPNIHNNVADILRELNSKYKHAPEVEWINCDLDREKIAQLYKSASCYVQVARGEGFGLPVAEAMLAKIPTICCNNSGMADFATSETSLIVGYDLTESKSHVNQNSKFVSLWCEPHLNELVEQFKYFMKNKDTDQMKLMVEKAYKLISEQYSWKAVAKRWESFINSIKDDSYKHLVAMVSTWNSKCGIAEFTRFQIDATKYKAQYEIFPNEGVDLLRKDEPFVRNRLWFNASDKNINPLIEALEYSLSDIVHIQFNFGFFNVNCLATLIEKLHTKKKIIVQFHKTSDAVLGGKKVSLKSIAKSLNKCAALIVHQNQDVDILKGFGVNPEIIHVISHGQIIYPYVPADVQQKRLGYTSKHIIGSYGFLLPHKGIKEVIESIPLIKKEIPDIYYIATTSIHDSDDSRNYYRECLKTISNLHLEDNVKLIGDYLSNDDALEQLQACNICVMPYKPTGESASGAVRFVAAANRPLITTKQPIFEEYSDSSLQIEECTPEAIAKAVIKLFNSDNTTLVKNIQNHVNETAWSKVGKEIISLYDEIDKQ